MRPARSTTYVSFDVIGNAAEFLGDIAVPLSLILLGASFARMEIPRPLSRLPIMAMFAAALAKMALLPVIGVFLVQGMVKGGLISREALAEFAELIQGHTGVRRCSQRGDIRGEGVCGVLSRPSFRTFLSIPFLAWLASRSHVCRFLP